MKNLRFGLLALIVSLYSFNYTYAILPDSVTNLVKSIFDGVPEVYVLKIILAIGFFAVYYGVIKSIDIFNTKQTKLNGVNLTVALVFAALSVLGLSDNIVNSVFLYYSGLAGLVLIILPFAALLYYTYGENSPLYMILRGLALFILGFILLSDVIVNTLDSFSEYINLGELNDWLILLGFLMVVIGLYLVVLGLVHLIKRDKKDIPPDNTTEYKNPNTRHSTDDSKVLAAEDDEADSARDLAEDIPKLAEKEADISEREQALGNVIISGSNDIEKLISIIENLRQGHYSPQNLYNYRQEVVNKLITPAFKIILNIRNKIGYTKKLLYDQINDLASHIKAIDEYIDKIETEDTNHDDNDSYKERLGRLKASYMAQLNNKDKGGDLYKKIKAKFDRTKKAITLMETVTSTLKNYKTEIDKVLKDMKEIKKDEDEISRKIEDIKTYFEEWNNLMTGQHYDKGAVERNAKKLFANVPRKDIDKIKEFYVDVLDKVKDANLHINRSENIFRRTSALMENNYKDAYANRLNH